MDADVLIIGAGPTGLMLAIQLARHGVRARIVDRHAGPSRETRALGVQARTMEIYRQLGVVARALELGMPATGANMWAEGRLMARVPLSEAGADITPYPYVFILGQDANERILGERLRELGGTIEWNTELVGLEQHEDGVRARLRTSGGSESVVDARWICGCDGAHSAVRTLSGIDFPGSTYEHVFFVADTESTGDMVPGELNVYLWRSGFHLFFPMRGTNRWRVVGIVPLELRDKEPVRFEDVLPSLQGEVGHGLAFQECSWFSTYRIAHRGAARFRDRRAFILGDAAHIHSPVGAQGMNTGLQDAYNLAWKLALVVRGRADTALLDSYEEERRPVARRLLSTTDQAFRFVVADGWLAGMLRTKVVVRLIAFAMHRRALQRLAFRTVSQVGISYRGSPLAVDMDAMPRKGPRAGDRFPWLRVRTEIGGPAQDLHELLDDRAFALVCFGNHTDASEVQGDPAQGTALRIISIPETQENRAALAHAAVAFPSYFLVRPDGYIGACGRQFDAARVRQYLARMLS